MSLHILAISLEHPPVLGFSFWPGKACEGKTSQGKHNEISAKSTTLKVREETEPSSIYPEQRRQLQGKVRSPIYHHNKRITKKMWLYTSADSLLVSL